MTTYLYEFFVNFDYPEESTKALLEAYSKISKNNTAYRILLQNVNKYNKDFNCDFQEMLDDCVKISELCEIREYTVKFLLFALLSKQLKNYYKEKNIDPKIWHASMLDLKYKLIECKLVKGIVGSFVCSWFSGFFNLTRFALGRLQFEIKPFRYDYEESGKKLKEGDPVINVHIPRSETPLDRESCLESYAMAKEFFKDKFVNTPMAFVCNSWLLFTKMREMLNENSNILKFMNDYHILNTSYAEQGNYEQMWRLYDMDYTGNLDDFPGDSSLRRAYKQYLKDGGRQGASYGVFFA